MRIVLTSAGSRGDVQPLQLVAAGLIRAGHSAVLCATPDFATSSEELGVPFVPSGTSSRRLLEEHLQIVRRFPLASTAHFRHAMRLELAERVRSLPDVARGADLVVASSLEFTASSVAEALGVPYRYIVLCPAILPCLLAVVPLGR